MARERDRMLDAIRGAAILAVVVFHLRIATGIPTLDRLLLPLVDLGWVGVDLFFVLSGVLVGGIILAEAESYAGFLCRRFFARRALRLWPVLYLNLAMLAAVGGTAGAMLVVPVLLHVQNFATDIPSHLWSLAVEEHFYLLAAFGLPWLLRRGTGSVAVVLVLLLVACPMLRIAALDSGVPPNAVQWQTPYRVDAIAAGVLIAWLERYRPDVIAAVRQRWRRCLACAAAAFVLLGAIDDLHWRYGIGLTIAWGAGALIIVALRRRSAPAALRPAIDVLVWLGSISYALYIWHVNFAQVAEALLPTWGIASPLAVMTGRYAFAILGATVIAAFVERPFMALRRREARPSGSRTIPHDRRIAIANDYRI